MEYNSIFFFLKHNKKRADNLPQFCISHLRVNPLEVPCKALANFIRLNKRQM